MGAERATGREAGQRAREWAKEEQRRKEQRRKEKVRVVEGRAAEREDRIHSATASQLRETIATAIPHWL
jgi:predicted deacetylase